MIPFEDVKGLNHSGKEYLITLGNRTSPTGQSPFTPRTHQPDLPVPNLPALNPMKKRDNRME
jgi:hypothetical protein